MMTIPELLKEHVSLDLECVDRVYLGFFNQQQALYPLDGYFFSQFKKGDFYEEALAFFNV